ncbi:serine/threonine kinase [Fragilaria crotonensis]|nr:serine/threonine kinase [Fragilaria crotonensis]
MNTQRFRHDNIIVLYGYNLNVDHEHQFLVYEYAANGSLDGFLKDDDKRALLPAATRLSIMFQVASAMDFLHTGKEGVKVFHRDIKSANICLMNDFKPKLVDCGLAKFAKDKHDAAPSESVVITGSTQGPALGTHGYMCPEYTWYKANQIKCDYIPAFDVYSFGVVMAELILGRLNDGKPTNVLQKYVLNRETATVGGWEQLENDADNQAGWNAAALELVCKTAIGCLIRISHGRLSTDMLLVLLEHASNLQAGKSGAVTIATMAKLKAILFKEGLGLCENCTESAFVERRKAVVKCTEDHLFCSKCLEDAMKKPGARNTERKLPCLIDGCSGLPFQNLDLVGNINHSVYNYFFNETLLEELNAWQSRIEPGLTLIITNAEQSNPCPSKVKVTPIAMECPGDFLEQKYQVVFCCERTGEPGHSDPFEIAVLPVWLVEASDFLDKIRPWLRIGSALDHTKLSTATSQIPGPSVGKRALARALWNNGSHDETLTLKGEALTVMAEMAKEPENLAKWKRGANEQNLTKWMVEVSSNGTKIWVTQAREQSSIPIDVDVTSHEQSQGQGQEQSREQSQEQSSHSPGLVVCDLL